MTSRDHRCMCANICGSLLSCLQVLFQRGCCDKGVATTDPESRAVWFLTTCYFYGPKMRKTCLHDHPSICSCSRRGVVCPAIHHIHHPCAFCHVLPRFNEARASTSVSFSFSESSSTDMNVGRASDVAGIIGITGSGSGSVRGDGGEGSLGEGSL